MESVVHQLGLGLQLTLVQPNYMVRSMGVKFILNSKQKMVKSLALAQRILISAFHAAGLIFKRLKFQWMNSMFNTRKMLRKIPFRQKTLDSEEVSISLRTLTELFLFFSINDPLLLIMIEF